MLSKENTACAKPLAKTGGKNKKLFWAIPKKPSFP
jgi:hypothetical protein